MANMVDCEPSRDGSHEMFIGPAMHHWEATRAVPAASYDYLGVAVLILAT